MIALVKKAAFSAFILIVAATLDARGANSVFHQGVTWTFSADRQTGQFANGEPWVVGPVTITNINPNPSQSTSGVENGSMKNPIPATRWGFESHADVKNPALSYDASKNVALQLPLTLSGNDALCSSITRSASSYPNYVDRVVVLTVLTTAPPAGSFRTGLFGTNHAVRWNKSQINYGVLKNFAATSLAPSKAQVENLLPPLPWFEWEGNALSSRYIGENNVKTGYFDTTNNVYSTYGREIALKWGQVGLWLQLSNSQADKEKAMIQTIQCGIDIWNYVTTGGNLPPDGGQRAGRKFPVVLAAIALNDPTLLAFAARNDWAQEDLQTFYVSQADINRQHSNPAGNYPQSMFGAPEWGVRHAYNPSEDNSIWEISAGATYYRHVVWNAMSGPVLAIDLMGRKDAWGHPAIFDYNDRYRAMGGMTGFPAQMFAYKSGGIIAPTGGAPGVVQNLTITATTASQTASWTGEAGTLQTHIFLLNPSTNVWGFLASADGNATSVQLSLPGGSHNLRAARQNSVTWSQSSVPVTVTVPSSSSPPSRPTGLRVVE